MYVSGTRQNKAILIPCELRLEVGMAMGGGGVGRRIAIGSISKIRIIKKLPARNRGRRRMSNYYQETNILNF